MYTFVCFKSIGLTIGYWLLLVTSRLDIGTCQKTHRKIIHISGPKISMEMYRKCTGNVTVEFTILEDLK